MVRPPHPQKMNVKHLHILRHGPPLIKSHVQTASDKLKTP